jgi:transcription antitermination factor NusG
MVRAEVMSGPLRGLQGWVEGRDRKGNRLILKVDLLGQAVAVEVDGSLLQAM